MIRVRWIPVSRRVHVHVNATIFEKGRGHVYVYATFSQKLRVHVTSMTVAWTWTPVSI